MHSAIAASSPLHPGIGPVGIAPVPEIHIPLGRSLLLIPVMAAMAWAVTIGGFWLVWQLLP